MAHTISGAEAIAEGALDAGVEAVTSYPGAPVTHIVEMLAASNRKRSPRVAWMSNEKTAIEAAYGASLAGLRSLLCVKSVGLNLALDPLMVMNLAGCCAGFVLVVGDDPGGWGSQNEQDSRWLAQVAELPLYEPCSVNDAYVALRDAYTLSEQTRLPVLVRVTRALVQASGNLTDVRLAVEASPPQLGSDCLAERHVVLPVDVVNLHSRLLEKMSAIRPAFERSPLNGEQGAGKTGVISAGFMYRKLMESLQGQLPAELRLLYIGTMNPFPQDLVRGFLQKVECALVLEETAPILERAVLSLVDKGAPVPRIFGRLSGHIAQAGEVMLSNISEALSRILPGFEEPQVEDGERPMPSREIFCEDCPYPPIFDALAALIDQDRGREKALVVGDPGCMVRAQLPPYDLLDVKTSLGSSVATAAGIALHIQGESQQHEAAGKLVALVGDSGFFHSGLQGLIDASRMGVDMLVVVLDNGVTALSGGQPHAGTRGTLPGVSSKPIDLQAFIHHMGIERVNLVDMDRGESIHAALAQVWEQAGLSVVIARGDCRPAV